MDKGKLYGIGVGPGDPELLTLKAVRIIQECLVVATPETGGGSALALDIVQGSVDLSKKTILRLHFAMSRDKDVLNESHIAAAQEIMACLDKGEDVAMLNLGDVSIFATFNYIKDIVQKKGYATEMVPGVPSFCAVAAKLDENLTPEMNTPFHIIPAAAEDLEHMLTMPGTKVIMKAGKPLKQVKQTLKQAGLYDNASLVQNCGLPDEKIAKSLDDAEENNGYFTTMVVKE